MRSLFQVREWVRYHTAAQKLHIRPDGLVRSFFVCGYSGQGAQEVKRGETQEQGFKTRLLQGNYYG